MRHVVLVALIGLAVSVFSAGAADAACNRAVSAKASKTIVPTGRIDQKMLDKAIRVEVNYHRCRAGLRRLGDAGNKMQKQAQGHSRWMAKTHQLTHRSNVSGRATLRDRLLKSGFKVKAGSENIGYVHRYQIDNRRFKIVDSGACRFSTYQGQALPAHSYASLARHIVQLWMDSPGHRKNILDRKVSHVTTAVAYDPNAQYCGRFWLTQNFIG